MAEDEDVDYEAWEDDEEELVAEPGVSAAVLAAGSCRFCWMSIALPERITFASHPLQASPLAKYFTASWHHLTNSHIVRSVRSGRSIGQCYRNRASRPGRSERARQIPGCCQCYHRGAAQVLLIPLQRAWAQCLGLPHTAKPNPRRQPAYLQACRRDS